MFKIHLLGVAVLLAGTIASTGQEADRPPSSTLGDSRAFPALTKIYEASGVRDSGSAEDTGVATTVFCSNLHPQTQQLRITIRNDSGFVAASQTFEISSFSTLTKSTHGTLLSESLPFLSPGVFIGRGVVLIAATAPQITCTVQVLDAATGVSIGDLHMVRFNPRPNTQE